MSAMPRAFDPLTVPHPVAQPVSQSARPSALRRAWRRFLALTRLDLDAVCAESAALGEHDYHAHTDDAGGATWDTEGCGHCARCGKRFRL